mmetsp:Transcript_20840/g.67120  ORF Transcript_20840/g.67120 Transcript_20840/m.67120 type:complete len:272 (+) Transcript_20840:143-958(+)
MLTVIGQRRGHGSEGDGLRDIETHRRRVEYRVGKEAVDVVRRDEGDVVDGDEVTPRGWWLVGVGLLRVDRRAAAALGLGHSAPRAGRFVRVAPVALWICALRTVGRPPGPLLPRRLVRWRLDIVESPNFGWLSLSLSSLLCFLGQAGTTLLLFERESIGSCAVVLQEGRGAFRLAEEGVLEGVLEGAVAHGEELRERVRVAKILGHLRDRGEAVMFLRATEEEASQDVGVLCAAAEGLELDAPSRHRRRASSKRGPRRQQGFRRLLQQEGP